MHDPKPIRGTGWMSPARSRLSRQVGAALLALGLDPRKLLHLRMARRFIADRGRFRRAGGRIDHLMPILSDYQGQAGSASGHYFHQDLLVATLIHEANPRRHIDIGSRLDGFVAHVASFRNIEVLDVRPMGADNERISFLQYDVTVWNDNLFELSDSVSCLHALEHFGLGRYGDAINPNGHLEGFENIYRMLQPGGTLYLSLPIGARGVYFNAHRVFDPREPLEWANDRLSLSRFDYVDDHGQLHRTKTIDSVPSLIYGCGIYTFKKRGP